VESKNSLSACERSQAEALGIPMVEQSHAHYKALLTAGVCADWRGKLVVPRGLAVDAHGCVDLEACSRVH